MRLVRRLLLLVMLAVAAAKLALLLKRRFQVRVDLYFEDGSLVTFGEDDSRGAELFALARDVRRAAA
jgi:hypothetical protein